VVERPLERVFPFFEKPENLALITPPALAFRLLTPSPVPMERGRVIDYEIRILGLGLGWRSIISSYDPPHYFVDEQLKGPYAFWHHAHWFEAQGTSTVLRDRVHYALPRLLVPPLRQAAHGLYVRPFLERIFDYRAQVFRSLFGGPLPSAVDTPVTSQPGGLT
jgi:ligand-binding SRPBCC domain-containing protein